MRLYAHRTDTLLLQRDFSSNFASIPPHGRWRHFDALSLPRITTLLSKWGAPTNGSTPVPPLEAARRLVDLFVVSVLLDAGAGPTWCYEERATGLRIGRSEGLAVASLDMFTQGVFALPEQADGKDAEKERCEGELMLLCSLKDERRLIPSDSQLVRWLPSRPHSSPSRCRWTRSRTRWKDLKAEPVC